MAMSTLTNRAQYTANGVNTIFAFPYKFFEGTDLKVYVGTTLKTLTTDYTVQGIPPGSFYGGGNVVFGAAPASLSVVTIVRNVPRTQSSDYQDYPNYAAAADVFENDLDRRAMCEQELADEISRILKIPETDPIGLDMTLPTAGARANKFGAYDASGKPIAAAGMASVPVTSWAATLLDDADSLTARTTLQIFPVASYMIANTNSPARWQFGADYLVAGSANLATGIAAAIAAGAEDVLVAPGDYTVSGVTTITTAINLSIRGCGKATKITCTTGFIYLNGATGHFRARDFHIVGANSSVATYYLRVNTAGARCAHESWSNITLELTGAFNGSIGFFGTNNVVHCTVYTTLTAYNWIGFQSCVGLSGCRVVATGSLTAGTIIAFNGGQMAVNCSAYFYASNGTPVITGFTGSYLVNCGVTIETTAAGTTGFGTGAQNCFACFSGKMNIGFKDVVSLSCCSAYGGTYAFDSCKFLTSCRGFSSATHDYIACLQMQQNTAETTGKNWPGASCYADQGTNAVANTAAGGYNYGH